MTLLRLPVLLLLGAWSVGCAAYQLGRRLLGRFGPTMPFRLIALGWLLGALVREPMAGVLLVAVAWAYRHRERTEKDKKVPPSALRPLSDDLPRRLAFGSAWLVGAMACALQGWAVAVIGCSLMSLWCLVGPGVWRRV